MNAIESVKDTLRPKFEDLLLHLNGTDQMAAAGFFTKLFVDLNAVASEEQLLELFIELSTTAFIGISFDELALAQIDDILLTAEQVKKAIRKAEGSGSHYPDGTLVCVENTSNLGGGACYSQEALDEIAAVAKENGCATHIDGARIFNASIATGVDVARMCRDYDSVSICLSKGLGAPVGSVLVGSQEFINKAHRWRKMFGGGWRQAGVLAAAGLHALDHHVERLVEDHARARKVAEAINAMDNFSVDLEAVQSNLVYVNCNIPAADLVVSLAEHGIDMFDLPYNRVRVAIHLHITDEDVDRIIAAFAAQ